MQLGRALAGLVSSAVVVTFALPRAQTKPPIGVDDLMKLRSVVDVQISPDGQRVAYVVSTPNLAKNEHEAALFVVPVAGGAPSRLGETVRIFNIPTPRPQLRWSPDGGTARGHRHTAVGCRSRTADAGAGRGVHLRVVA
jgi:dipeptidyl aminopeptidase/acylaminoacyl peptidase